MGGRLRKVKEYGREIKKDYGIGEGGILKIKGKGREIKEDYGIGRGCKKD